MGRPRTKEIDDSTSVKDALSHARGDFAPLQGPHGDIEHPADLLPEDYDPPAPPVEARALIANSRRSQHERDATSRGFWRRAFEEERLAQEEHEPYRIHVAWRLTRLHLTLRGRLGVDEGLEDDETDWSEPLEAPSRHRLRPAELLVSKELLALIAQHPTSIDPPADPALYAQWHALHRALTHSLRLPDKIPRYPYASRRSLRMFIEEFATYWPTREQLVIYEESVVEETFDVLIKKGTRDALALLVESYGLSSKEALGTVKISKARAKRILETDIDEERAVMLLRLEDLRERAKVALDLRSEMNALKAIAIVQGFGRAEPEDALADFTRVVKKVAHQANGAPTKPMLTVASEPKRLTAS